RAPVGTDDRELQGFFLAQNADGDAVAGPLFPQLAVELRARADLLRLHLHDNIALFEAALLPRPAGDEARDDDMAAHVLRVDAEPRPRRAAAHAPVLLQFRLVLQIELDRDRERALGDLAEIERHDAHQPAGEIDQRAAAHAGIRRGQADALLQHVFPVAVVALERSDVASARAALAFTGACD